MVQDRSRETRTYSGKLGGLLGDSLLEVVGELDDGAGKASHGSLGNGGGNLISRANLTCIRDQFKFISQHIFALATFHWTRGLQWQKTYRLGANSSGNAHLGNRSSECHLEIQIR